MNTVNVTSVTNQVVVSPLTHVVTPQVIHNLVSTTNVEYIISAPDEPTSLAVINAPVTVAVEQQKVTLTQVENPVSVTVISEETRVVTAGFRGPPGVDAVSNEIIVLNKAEEKDIIEDSPSADDITVYYGIADPQSATSDPVWLITRQIFYSDGTLYDSSKRFASANYDQIWDNRLSLTYT